MAEQLRTLRAWSILARCDPFTHDVLDGTLSAARATRTKQVVQIQLIVVGELGQKRLCVNAMVKLELAKVPFRQRRFRERAWDGLTTSNILGGEGEDLVKVI